MRYSTIETPYLIQRAKWRHKMNLEKKGIDQIIEFDYMGSSEFEWGALPKSLKRIREHISDYVWTHTEMYSIFSHRDQVTDILDAVTKLKLKEIHTKEFTAMREGICPNTVLNKLDYDFGFRIWWDIVNDFFIFSKKGFTKNEFKDQLNKFQSLIYGAT